jgi:hypothetical protein
MDALIDKFKKMGARAKIETIHSRDQRLRRGVTAPRIDIETDREGEYFSIQRPSQVQLDVLDLWKSDRHLLLMTSHRSPEISGPMKSKFLCGHDERHWFVAAVPEDAKASNIQQAMDALKPSEVWEAMEQFGVRMRDRNQRRTAGFVRQGEWFFIPMLGMSVKENRVLRDEPIRRGAGKPHLCQFVYRDGGEDVWVSPIAPNGLTQAEYGRMPRQQREKHRWTRMRRNAAAYARGTVKHRDHETIVLEGWHRIVMNTETRAAAMQHVAFLD